MARINIADKETLDYIRDAVTNNGRDLIEVGNDLSATLSRVGHPEDLSVDTLFGLIKLLALNVSTSPVKSIKRGYITVSSGSNSITHEEVDVNKSIVIFNASPAGSNVDHGTTLISRTSTSLVFSARNTVSISWQILEFN